MEPIQAKHLSNNRSSAARNDENPPNNFRNMSIYPLPKEITTNQTPFLRENIVKGKYRDVDHYLDVQFRLLREDFVAPLREGICNYLKKGHKHLDNVRIFHDVRFIGNAVTNEQMGVKIQFTKNTSNLSNTNNNTKRFMFGSLLCFTADNFKSIFFGKMIDSQLKYLKYGQIIVGFEPGAMFDFNCKFSMVECCVFFEPYYQVLKAMQAIKPESLALAKYLVDVETSNESPQYLTNVLKNIDENARGSAYKSAILGSKGLFMGLNESQSDAYKAALTNEFCIIQGPPGTGKTHLALEVTKTLLENPRVWRTGPILVVCLTNHALDQFLEGLLDTTEEIVRVGGQSKSEKLTNYNLKNIRRKYRKSKKIDNSVSKHLYNNVKAIGHELYKWTNNLNAAIIGKKVIKFNCFKAIDAEFANSWFDCASNDELVNWLIGGRNNKHFQINDQILLSDIANNNVNVAMPHNYEDFLKNLMQNLNTSPINVPSNNNYEKPSEMNIKNRSEHFLEVDEDLFADLVNASNSSSCLIGVLQIGNKIEELDGFIEKSVENLDLIEKRSRLNEIRDYLSCRLIEVKWKQEIKKPKVDLNKPYEMSSVDRWKLYNYWVNRYCKLAKANIAKLDREYRESFAVYSDAKTILDANIMRTKLIIGMTTTGAARLQLALNTIKAPIVIVEEAAEVLESHIITSLTKYCQHLILIGDHQQLRPSTADYRMEIEYKLGISLFERMVQNKVQCNLLTVQHRMRPEIARLITPIIYPKLDNHASVYNYPKIRGINKSLYFITHTNSEIKSGFHTKENDQEAEFLVSLARYLVLNGYKAAEITILAAYSGQLFNIKRRMDNFDFLGDTKVCVLDSYQGEENKIILLSLVRNNKEGKIGFLSLENRVCVALSRAKHGFYMMGNMDLLSACLKPSNPWPQIKLVLEELDSIGDHLLLHCENHPNQVIHAKSPADFAKRGGCNQICNNKLTCGHICNLTCHVLKHAKPPLRLGQKVQEFGENPENVGILTYRCSQQCNQIICEEAHICPKKCYEKCEPCEIPKKLILSCGHALDVPCHVQRADAICPILILRKLPCNHTAFIQCHNKPYTFAACPQPCKAIISACGHRCSQTCHAFNDKHHKHYKCISKCAKPMKSCSMALIADKHICQKMCYEKCNKCYIRVQKTLHCGHKLWLKCSDDVDAIKCKESCN